MIHIKKTHIKKAISNLELELFLLKELPPDRQNELEAVFASDPSLTERLNQLKTHSEGFFTKYPIHPFVDRLQHENPPRMANKPSIYEFWDLVSSRGYLPRVASLSFAILFLLTVPVVYTTFMDSKPAPTERVKGLAPYLVVYKKVGSSFQKIEPNSHVAPHDLIQVAYNAAKMKFGLVFSVDQAKRISYHLPSQPTKAVALEVGREILLSESFELDDSKGHETFYFISSDQPFDVLPIVEKLLNTNTGQVLDSGYNTYRFAVKK